MKMFKIIKKIIKEPYRILLYIDKRNIYHLKDKVFLSYRYESIFKKKLNLVNPQTYNEKIQWLKLNDRKDIYTTMVDKYEAKRYVANIIGEEYVIPTIGVYNSFDEIDFDKLPKQFVIKCTHDSGGVIVVKDKNKLNIDDVKSLISKSLKTNFYYRGREWPYKNVKPRIIIEPYLEDKKVHELRDYKFFAFSGKVKLMFIASNRQGKGDTYFDFFDRNFKHLDIINGHPMNPKGVEKPKNYKKMIELAEKLSNKVPQVRIDFYEINGKIYFGEITFYHWSGFTPFEPEEWDLKLGKLIELPRK